MISTIFFMVDIKSFSRGSIRFSLNSEARYPSNKTVLSLALREELTGQEEN